MRTHIVIHHSASADHETLLNIEAIRRFHMDVNKWRDIGYSHVIESINGHWEVLLGRMPGESLAHCPQLNLNTVGYGICVVGNFDMIEPPDDALAVLRRLCIGLMKQDGIPVENILGHWEAQAAGGVPVAERKTCPGKLFDLEAFRSSLKEP